MRRVSILVCVCALVSTSLLAADAENPAVTYRQDVMKTLDEQSSALGEIASGVIPADNMTAHMQILALAASTALKAFEPKVPGGKSKPEIWTNWDDFSSKMKDFQAKAAAGAKADGQDAQTSALIDIANGCKGCHDMYRQEMKDQ